MFYLTLTIEALVRSPPNYNASPSQYKNRGIQSKYRNTMLFDFGNTLAGRYFCFEYQIKHFWDTSILSELLFHDFPSDLTNSSDETMSLYLVCWHCTSSWILWRATRSSSCVFPFLALYLCSQHVLMTVSRGLDSSSIFDARNTAAWVMICASTAALKHNRQDRSVFWVYL